MRRLIHPLVFPFSQSIRRIVVCYVFPSKDMVDGRSMTIMMGTCKLRSDSIQIFGSPSTSEGGTQCHSSWDGNQNKTFSITSVSENLSNWIHIHRRCIRVFISRWLLALLPLALHPLPEAMLPAMHLRKSQDLRSTCILWGVHCWVRLSLPRWPWLMR